MKGKLVFLALVFAVLLMGLGRAFDGAVVQAYPLDWHTLMSEDFEAEFPRGLWFVGPLAKDYWWGVRDCNPHSGDYSVWAGGGGPGGSQIPCTGHYASNAQSIMRYGPFDLSGCTEARVSFAQWTKTANDDDFFGFGFGVDGRNFRVLRFAADTVSTCDGWCDESFDITEWSAMGQLCGQPEVWMLFSYSTDDSGVDHGVFVDDILLEAYYDVEPTVTVTPALNIYLPLWVR